ncbi:MAG: radical SAM protein [Candidatus Aenigmatarchaeota archaeon]
MTELKYVAFHLTYVCKNKCPYCYIGNDNRTKEPHFDTVRKILQKIAKAGVRNILLVGGDVCTYSKLKDVVIIIKELGMNICIMSNTLDFGNDLDFFSKNVDKFHTTILGSNKREHDAEAGRVGAYEELIKNIKKLNKKGRKIGVAVSIHKNNYKNIKNMVINLIDNEKIQMNELVIQRVIPRGRAKDTKSFSITKDQANEIFKQLDEINKKYNLEIDFEDAFPLCIIDKKFHYLQKHGCEWGIDKVSVNFTGNLSRCSADERFLLGNIFKIKDIQKFWRENKTLIDFRNKTWLPKKCHICNLLQKCGGGCPLSQITNKDHDCDFLCLQKN